MPYGTIKVDTVTFTNAGIDKSVTISGLVQNPTFSGDVTVIGTLSGVTVTGTTANFTSGNFTNISGGTHTITSGVFAAGSAASPSITFTGDLNTGIYSPGADQVSVTTGGTERLRVDSTGQIEAVSLGAAAAPVFSFTTDPNTGIYSPGADQVAISTNGTGRLFVDASGNVGITESSPSSHSAGAGVPTLVLKGSSATFPSRSGALALVSQDGTSAKTLIYHDTDFFIQNTTATNTRFLTNNTERLRITSAGLVGIGTSSPSTRLSVVGSVTGLANGAIRTNTTGGTQSANSGLWLCGNQATTHYNWLIASQYNVGGALEITPSTAVDGATFSTPTAVFTQTGRVGIGTTSVDANSLLHVSGGDVLIAKTSGYAALNFNFSNFLTARGGAIKKNYDSPFELRVQGGNNATTAPICFDRADGFENARFDTSGRLLVGTSSVRSVSSAFQGGGAAVALFQLETPDLATGIFSSNRNDQFGPYLALVKSRGTSSNAVTLVNSGDCIGGVTFNGTDGSTATTGAAIAAFVDGTPSANDMPGRLVFSVTADGAASPTEALRISSNRAITISDGGNVVLGTTTGTKIGTATTQKLGFYNATPVVQPTAVANATDAATVITQLNDLLAKLRTLGIIAT